MVPISVIGLAYGAASAALLSGGLALAVFYTRGRARARGTAVAQPEDPQAGGRIGSAALQPARAIDYPHSFWRALRAASAAGHGRDRGRAAGNGRDAGP